MKFLSRLSLTLLLFAFFAAGAQAQAIKIKGGLSLSTAMESFDGEKIDEDYVMLPGYVFGGTYTFSTSAPIDIEAGLLFVSKGVKVKETDGDERLVARVVTHNFELPVVARYTFENDGFKPFVGAGFYMSYAFDGKTTVVFEDSDSKSKQSFDLDIGNNESDDIKPFDAGLQFTAGVSTGKLEFALTYDLGLANISTFTDFDSKTKNRSLMLTAGFQIN